MKLATRRCAVTLWATVTSVLCFETIRNAPLYFFIPIFIQGPHNSHHTRTSGRIAFLTDTSSCLSITILLLALAPHSIPKHIWKSFSRAMICSAIDRKSTKNDSQDKVTSTPWRILTERGHSFFDGRNLLILEFGKRCAFCLR
jgi:hypothetical protein